ncbi:hypothetical protein FB451DRAFT_1385972 [Mycena latifolia]|nr:hypothetical protein FB451DRAFT_1385972 [Mycena latifolia]
MSSLSSPPFIVVEGVINIRDIGGYVIEDSTLVKSGLVFRSGEISNITETGKQQLLALGIRRVFDMRTQLEITSYKTTVLILLGVPDADITKDYTLTAVGLKPARAALIARMQSIQVFRDNLKGTVNMGSAKFVFLSTYHPD